MTANFAQYGRKYGFKRKFTRISLQSFHYVVSFVQQKQAVDPERAMFPKKLLSKGRFKRMPMNSKEGKTMCLFF